MPLIGKQVLKEVLCPYLRMEQELPLELLAPLLTAMSGYMNYLEQGGPWLVLIYMILAHL